MNAPIDDLLYGGDDSGDEDMNVNGTSMPMNNFKIPMVPGTTMPLPTSVGAIGVPGMFNGGAIGMGMVPGGIPTQSQALKPPGTVPMTVRTTVAPTPAAAAKQPGTGQQMFQQMFALLKQMLPPEQYATLHSEMRKGNGNDIKSIVDIIKRIAGDAIFASVIQKMDLTRSFPSSANQVKAEPSITAQPASVMAAQVPLAMGSTGAAMPVATPLAPPAAVIGTTTAAVQRPSVPVPAAVTPVVKTEPAPAATTTSSAPTTRNEALDKIEFAKKLLFHASTCLLPAGQCKVKKCDDVRRVFKHSASCGGARGCNHCEQLKGLVKYHAKDCKVSITDHCKIPFCDGLRRAFANAAAALAAKGNAAAVPTPTSAATAVSSVPAKTSASGANLSSDDDNAPLVSSIKKKGSTKKSPKASANTTASPVSTNKNGAATSSTPTSSAAATKSKATPANPTQEYGRLLQLILHVQKCTTSACPIGEECVEAKTLLTQINAPNAPKRAQTYKQVYSHYKQCLSKNNTKNCPVCKIGLRPITPANSSTLASPSPSPAVTPTAAATTSSTTASPTNAVGAKRPATTSSSGSSPPKKQQKSSSSLSKKNSTITINSAVSEEANSASLELAQSNVADLRKEADVLTHTGIELSSERRTMMDGVRRQAIPLPPEQLPCKKEEWQTTDLFNNQVLKNQMEAVGKKIGVQMGKQTTEVMSYALQEYLKQVIEEMVEISKQRCDSFNQALEEQQKRSPSRQSSASGAPPVELTATDILRVSCENSFAQARADDLMLRAQLLEDAKREEQLEKERAKKRKKVDRSKLTSAQEREKEEKDMDIVELATKDLKEKLFKEDKGGVVRVDGRVNESIHTKYQRRSDAQVTMEDAAFWLQSQKPYINPKLFIRAEAARVVTNSLN